MKRIMLTVAYDGTNYNGWQLQPEGKTIEGELAAALKELLSEDITLTSASRTDAGVHALCNKTVFDTSSLIPAEKFSYALNRYLPDDIRITASEEVSPGFHPRKVPVLKTYEYKIYNAPFADPTKRLYSCFTYVPLDVGRMREAGAFFEGERDFAAVSTYKPEVLSTVRNIISLEISEEKLTSEDSYNILYMDDAAGKTGSPADKKKPRSMITVRITGTGFLYHMVRIIAGTLMEVGRGRIEPSDIPGILDSKDRKKAGPTAPACGLTLKEIRFL